MELIECVDCLSVDHRIFTEIDVDESFKLEHSLRGRRKKGRGRGEGEREKGRERLL